MRTMAKFTVYFQDKAIQSQLFDSGVIRIGRDETNDIIIDNLAVAPVHAAVVINESGCTIKQLNDGHPLIVNNNKTKEIVLQNNDKITIGKYSIIFHTTEAVSSSSAVPVISKDVKSLNGKLEESINISEASLQVLDGVHIGRILPLKKSMTRLGRKSGVAVISRRKEGYFISSLDGVPNILVNKEHLDDKALLLNNNDIIVIDDVSMQFFLEQ